MLYSGDSFLMNAFNYLEYLCPLFWLQLSMSIMWLLSKMTV